MKKNNLGSLFVFADDDETNETSIELEKAMAEVEEEFKKSDEAFKNYKKPEAKPLTISDGTQVYIITGHVQMSGGTSFNDFLNDINGTPTPHVPQPGDGQHYMLEQGIAKIKTSKKGVQTLSISKKTTLDDKVGASAWGPLYPGGPIETDILYGNQTFNAESFGENWFTDYNAAVAKFNLNVARGYEYKF